MLLGMTREILKKHVNKKGQRQLCESGVHMYNRWYVAIGNSYTVCVMAMKMCQDHMQESVPAFSHWLRQFFSLIFQ